MPEQTRIHFTSQDADCAGYFTLPEERSGRVPCVILCHGFSGTMDWILPRFAERFAAAGMAVLMFDYRHFGESGGRPRQLVSVKRQRQDIRAALRFVRTQPSLDPKRIALWGTSMGGGHVIDVAASEPELGAVIAQVPGIDFVRTDARATIEIPTKTVVKLLAAAASDAVRGFLGLSPHYVKVFSDTGELAVFTDAALKPRFDALREGSATWRNEFTPRFYLSPPRYRSGTAERLRMPLLVCVADGDVYANPKFQAWVGGRAPLGVVKHYACGHFDAYHDWFEEVVRDQISFLQANLKGA